MIADAAAGVEHSYSLKQIVIVINPECACVRMSAEDDDFQREGAGMCVLNVIGEVLCFGLSDI